MLFSNTLFACATMVAVAVAQVPTSTTIHFTSTPTSLVAGVKQTIGWAGGNGDSVTIILRQGLSTDLKDVPIPAIASGVEGNSTTWTPPKSLPDADNYALQIKQGKDINYSGMIPLSGGCSTCPSNAIVALASTSASQASIGTASTSSPSSTASSSSSSVAGTPIVSSGSNSTNSTGAAGSSSNSTITSSGTNSTTSTGSFGNSTTSGTNSTSNSNSTLSSATLRATSTKTSSSSSAPTSSSTSSSSSGSTSSSTGSSAKPSPTGSSAVTVAASNLALVLCAVVGVIYLG